MDDLDRQLIAELRINGRASVPQLAQILGVARATAQKRLDRLIATGDIKGFTVRLKDDASKDLIRAFILVEISGSPRNPISAIKRLPGVASLSNTNGHWDMIAEIEVSTMSQLNELISTVRATEGVSKSETFIMLGPA
ncbi:MULTISPECIES: Lrp/AsnC family transcriptional regulator [unclassified Rhizobium]|jgi:DNA-binding Lrp family transcriptional regulator|uniref:Lrp/AsnC family transcriptional regulator n=1 Tax=unclassified Rhizobium TaxID=2613769 RepID=UPI00064821E1|nr:MULTISPECIES: Lrp/AsnC family transcriptional regulator [unclassified Rhizobium]MBN8950632.1 Lrp/AsnC family transcriptional regulator [Rhizobium tropici]OJY66174.1 MAG: AsnC family transcriptional regulator [Rhizobium sp. 60-20]RKD69268.1 DNA-binding Lrp family transcriptional regulator [Rhizobium sp. WW_1]